MMQERLVIKKTSSRVLALAPRALVTHVHRLAYLHCNAAVDDNVGGEWMHFQKVGDFLHKPGHPTRAHSTVRAGGGSEAGMEGGDGGQQGETAQSHNAQSSAAAAGYDNTFPWGFRRLP